MQPGYTCFICRSMQVSLSCQYNSAAEGFNSLSIAVSLKRVAYMTAIRYTLVMNDDKGVAWQSDMQHLLALFDHASCTQAMNASYIPAATNYKLSFINSSLLQVNIRASNSGQ